MRLTPHPTAHPTRIRPARTGPQPSDPPSDLPPARLRRRVLVPAAAVALAAALAVLAAVLAAVLGAAPALADGGVRVVAVAGSVSEVLTNLRNWLMGILAGLATVFLTVGGVRYLMAGGDPGEVEKAKTAFKSAAWGYAAAALAPLVVTILEGLVGA